MKFYSLLLGIALAAIGSLPAWAQTSAPDAVHIAQGGVDPSIRDRVISVYGIGGPSAIHTWWVIFYDPSVPSHGQAIRVDNGKVGQAYPANAGVVYDSELAFPISAVSGEGPALGVAQDYAAKHAIAYDHVRALLRITPTERALRWRVQLLDGKTRKGFVFIDASTGVFATYSPAGSESSGVSSATGDSVQDSAVRAGNDIKDTFLGIGGDLQQFFTGERTVDR